MKGIILAGGRGTRLSPLTKNTSKQLLPVYDKPMIHYPLSTLMLAGIREVLVIVAKDQKDKFMEVLGSGKELGISISYLEQESPRGIAEAFIIGSDFIASENVALILGDNIFHGPSLGRHLSRYRELNGAQIFGYKVKNPEHYGVAVIDKNSHVTSLIEKPQTYQSNVAIPGLYFFDKNVVSVSKEIEPSVRGELEIIDVLKVYLRELGLKFELLPRGTAWFDSGTFSDLHDASTYVRLIEERTGERVGDLSEISELMNYSDD
jgi:glucose-1-phosphate thymidylyltransferase